MATISVSLLEEADQEDTAIAKSQIEKEWVLKVAVQTARKVPSSSTSAAVQTMLK
jgi:hypothetical protein